VWPEPLQRVERRAAVLRRLDVVRGLEEHSERFPRAELVVDDEDTRERGRRGDGAHAPATGRDTTNASSLRAWRTRRSPPRATSTLTVSGAGSRVTSSWIGLPRLSSATWIVATTSSTTVCTSTVVKFSSPSVTSAASFSKTSTSRRTSRRTTEEKCLRKSGSS